jgi:integrase
MASVYLIDASPNWLAAITVWKAIPHHPKGGFLHRTRKSTGLPRTEPMEVAQRVADEMERIGQEKRPAKIPDKAFFETRVAALMRSAGIEPQQKTATWKEFSSRWLGGLDVSEGTLNKYTAEVRHFTDFLGIRGNHDLRTITTEDCEDFFNSIKSSGRASSTAKNTTKTVRSVLRKAHLLGYIDKNPADALVLKTDSVALTKEPFTRSELDAIFSFIRGQIETNPTPKKAAKYEDWLIACHFGLYYGLRAADAVNRRGEEIRVQDGIRVIRFVPQKKKRKGQIITLPLVGELANLPEKGLLTPSLSNKRHSGKGFELILEKCNIGEVIREAKGEGRNVNSKGFHSFRHTANTMLNDAGIDIKTRQLICDHDDTTISLRYTHSTVEQMAAAIDKAILRRGV